MIEQDKMIIEHEFTKLEIATYLKDFHQTAMLAAKYYNQSFFEVFLNAMAYDNRIQFANSAYYQEMMSIYQFQVLSKYLTILYDEHFKRLLGNRIKGIDITKEIFIDPSKSNFENTDIIDLIRKGFNHNDTNTLLKFLRVNENGKRDMYAKLRLENKKNQNMPFEVKLNLGDFAEIISQFKSTINFSLLALRGEETTSLDNIYVRKFYPPGTPSKDQLKNLHDKFSKMQKQGEYESLLKENGLTAKDYFLLPSQKEKIKEDLKKWPTEGTKVLFHIVSNVMPLSYLKFRTIVLNLCLVDFFMKKPECSLKRIEKEAIKIFTNKKCLEDSPLFTYTKYFGIDNVLYDVLDFENSFSLASAIYYGYLFDTLTTGKGNIEITPGKEVERKKLRNSFVHMRWHRGVNGSWKLFDWKNENKIKGDFSEVTHENISSKDMEECSKRIYREKLEQEGQKNSFINIPPVLEYVYMANRKNIADAICYIKDSNLYFLSYSNVNATLKLKVIQGNQLPKDATEEEQEMFINELHNLSNRVNKYCEILIKQIINTLQLI
jgi:hypothetical protein